jgi:hypothetical protein
MGSPAHGSLDQPGGDPFGHAADLSGRSDDHFVLGMERELIDDVDHLLRIVDRRDGLDRLAAVVRRMLKEGRIVRHRHDGADVNSVFAVLLQLLA